MILAIGTQGNPNLVRCPVGEGAHVQYQLDDPGEYVDEHIVVIGAGDAGIENAMGLAADPQQRNTVTIVNRSADFATAKDANVKALLGRREAEGRITVLTETDRLGDRARATITFDTRDGELQVALRPGHRAHGLGPAARLRRGLAPNSRTRTARRRSSRAPDRVHQRRPRRLSQAVADLRDRPSRAST